MENKPLSQKAINRVLSILGILLVALGAALIIRSEFLYRDSVQLANTVLLKTGYKSVPGTIPNYAVVKDSYTEALIYFTLAIGCIILMLLLPRIQSVNIGPGGVAVTLQALQQNMNALITQGNSVAAGSAGTGGIPAAAAPLISKATVRSAPVTESNHRNLSVTVKPSPLGGEFFEVVAIVKSLDPVTYPLGGPVSFQLDASFHNPAPKILALEGEAILDLKKVIGPFVLGASADHGKTKLSIDLATLEGLPGGFIKS